MKLLARIVDALKRKPTLIFVRDTDTKNTRTVLGNKNDYPNHCTKQSPTELCKSVSSRSATTEPIRPKHKRSTKLRSKHSQTSRTLSMEIETVRSEIGKIPKEINCNASFQAMRPRIVNGSTSTIPKEISFQASSSSVDSDLESEERPRARRTQSGSIGENKRQRDFHNKCICLELLESERFDENCIGMEHLVTITNHELVNSARFVTSECCDNNRSNNRNIDESLLTSTIAYSLLCNSNAEEKFSKRLRAVFPSFLCEHRADGGTVSLSQPSKNSSCSYSTTDTSIRSVSNQHGDSLGYSQSKSLLKLPALRILVSSLELLSRTKIMSPDSSTGKYYHSMNFSNGFWRVILTYMTRCLQGLVVCSNEEKRQEEDFLETSNLKETCKSCYNYDHHYQKRTTNPGVSPPPSSVEAALVVKGFRLLHKLQPEIMRPYVRYSLLPFVSNAREFGVEQQQLRIRAHGKHHRRISSGDKMLVRECERLLRSVDEVAACC